MKWALAQDYEVSLTEDRRSALELCKSSQPLVVLLDLGLPPSPGDPTEGLATLAELLEADPHLKIIIITGQSEKQIALQAIGQGAFDFLAKPVDMAELKVVVKRAFYLAHLESEHRRLREMMDAGTFEDMLG